MSLLEKPLGIRGDDGSNRAQAYSYTEKVFRVKQIVLEPLWLHAPMAETFSLRRNTMDGRDRVYIKSGLEVDIVMKGDQASGKTTRGIVKDILTNSASHPHGIKVRLTDGRIGRVKRIVTHEAGS
jgi:uncharacterized repeat protein (TIGR03833 family)